MVFNWIIYLATFLTSGFGFWYMKKYKPFKEKIRKELTHLDFKAQTSTCGGLVFLIVSICFGILRNEDVRVLIIILIGIIGGIMGFLDDLQKSKNKEGFEATKMLLFTMIVSLIPILYNFYNNFDSINIPLVKTLFGLSGIIKLWIFYIPLVSFLFAGSSHSIGITDGINGGLSSSMVINYLFLLIANKISQTYYGYFLISPDCVVYIICLIIMTSVFYFFNRKGKIFMANVGSNFLGYTLASIIILFKMELAMSMLGILYLIEASSVLLQLYFIRKYRRKIFLFTPIHHHFELKGYTTNQIVLMMCGTSILGGLGFIFFLFS